jgi:hypothetical protein
MYENIEKIIDLALVETKNDESLRLRFITPASLDAWIADEAYTDYWLTLPDEHDFGTDYISVSYC